MSLELFYESIQNGEYFHIGSFKKPIGLDGGILALFIEELDNEILLNIPALFVSIDHVKVPYSIRDRVITERNNILYLNLIESKTQAYALSNLPIFLPLALKPACIQNKIPYSLINGLVEAIGWGKLGHIQAIYSMPEQYIMAVDHHEKELLIPYTKPFLVNVNEVEKKVTVQLPEGYMEAML